MKKALIIVLALAVLAVALTGASKWPAKLWIWNRDTASTAYFNFGGDEYPIVQLTVGPEEKKVFELPRGEWDGTLTYCGVSKAFDIDATTNVWLSLPDCGNQKQRYAGYECVGWNTDKVCTSWVAKGKQVWFGEPSTREKVYMRKSATNRLPNDNWEFEY